MECNSDGISADLPNRRSSAIQSAQIQLEARRLEECKDLEAIGEIHRELASIELDNSVSELVRGFSGVSQEVSAALGRHSDDGQRLALIAVEGRLEGLLRELESSDKLYAYRFRSLVTQWRQIVADRVKELAMAVERRQEIDGPTP